MESPVLKAESPRFTPSRRLPSTINNRPQQGDLEKEWTATRCNRLLRALTSRVAILKKDISRLQSATGSKSSAVELIPANRQKRGNASPGDADWVHTRKKIKRTYSARGGKSNNEARSASNTVQPSLRDARRLIPGEITIPTLILHQARGQPASQSSAPAPEIEHPQSPEGNWKKHSKTMRDIRKSTPAHRYTTYEGIYYGLEGLLRATTLREQDPNLRGPGSLLSMCLRAIPQYITQEEVLLAEQLEETGCKSAIDRRDVSTEVYDDLEAFGSSGHGWKHLRTVVRSHGIQVMCVAIQDGLIDMEFCGILISLCVNMRATREAESLLCALLSASIIVVPKSVFTRFDDHISTRPLLMFWKYVAHRSSLSYQYRQLSSMIANGLLPISWLATKEFATFWPRAVQEFSSDSVDSDAVSFLDTVLPLLATYGDPGHRNRRLSDTADEVLLDAVKQTFSSLIATLTAVVILRKETIVETEGSQPYLPDCREVISLFRTCLAQWKLCRSFKIRGTLIVLAAFLVESCNGDPSDRNLVDLFFDNLRHTNRSTQLCTPRNDLVLFVCSISRCCGRGASNSGFEYLQRLHTILETVAHNRELDGGRIVQEIIIDSAFAFARQVPNGTHLDYATSLEVKFHVTKPGSRGSSPSENSDGKAGYRWEEGISEWVVATPAPSSVKAVFLEEDSTGESECDTPFYRARRRAISTNSVRSSLMIDLAPSPSPSPSPSPDIGSKYEYTDISRPSTRGCESIRSEGCTDEENDMGVTERERVPWSESDDSDEENDMAITSRENACEPTRSDGYTDDEDGIAITKREREPWSESDYSDEENDIAIASRESVPGSESDYSGDDDIAIASLESAHGSGSDYSGDEYDIAIAARESALGSESEYSDEENDIPITSLESDPPSESEDEPPTSPIKGADADLEIDELSTPVSSSPASDTTSSPFGPGRRQYVDRAPRPRKSVLQHSSSLHWQLYDDSDDELSCLSIASPGDNNPSWQDSTGGSGGSAKPPHRRGRVASLKRGRSTTGLDTSSSWQDESSEDELGI